MMPKMLQSAKAAKHTVPTRKPACESANGSDSMPGPRSDYTHA
jgi:hypothetical protein